MADEKHRPARVSHVVHLSQALLLKCRVPHCQNLVHQQDLRLKVGRHRESEPHIHPARVALHRRIDELL